MPRQGGGHRRGTRWIKVRVPQLVHLSAGGITCMPCCCAFISAYASTTDIAVAAEAAGLTPTTYALKNPTPAITCVGSAPALVCLHCGIGWPASLGAMCAGCCLACRGRCWRLGRPLQPVSAPLFCFPSRYDESNHTRFPPGDASKRAFTYFVLTGGRFVGASAVRLAVLKFLLSMTATKDVLAMASLEVDLSNIEPGQTVTVKWRGKPVFIRHRWPRGTAGRA